MSQRLGIVADAPSNGAVASRDSANVAAAAGGSLMSSTQVFKPRTAGRAHRFRALLGLLVFGFGLFAACARNAMASTTITGAVGSSGKYLVTGAPVTTTAVTVLKLSFENKTPGTNLELCAGTAAEFAAGTCSVRLSDSGGPGFVFLTITDTSQLSGKFIFVQRVVGIATSTFALTVE
ncbi:MAG TPA: hypothetical protein VGZ73_31125 [Bryobacteraceae bacterium]|jgi:hypothetical protein|nr:hypothetical protein [Bryobacteraceae bacterium]